MKLCTSVLNPRFVSKSIGINPMTRNYGANRNNIQKGQGPEGFNQTVEYSVGGNFLIPFLGEEELSTEDVDKFIERQNQTLGREMIDSFLGNPVYKKCKPCGKEIPIDADGLKFSEQQWGE